jgi:hypothetical protein
MIGLFIGVLGVCALLAFWQPAALKTKLFDYAARTISETTPYDVQIESVSGSLWRGFSLHHIRLLTKPKHVPVLELQQIKVGVRWRALLFHKVIQIDHLEIDLDGGTAVLQGDLLFKSTFSEPITIRDQNFPLHKLLALSSPAAAAIPLIHTGLWTFHKQSQQMTIEMKGLLDEAPVILQGSWNDQQLYRVRLTWNHLPLSRLWAKAPAGLQTASVHVQASGQGMRVTGTGQLDSPLVQWTAQLKEGEGPFHASVHYAGFNPLLEGRVNLPKKSVRGQATLEEATWADAHADHIEAHFDVTPRRQILNVTARNLQSHHAIQNAMDIKTATLSLNGLPPHWQSDATVEFRNGASGQMSGPLTQSEKNWILVWQKLVFTLPFAGSWIAQNEGSLFVTPAHRFTLRNLSLANGAQRLQIPEALYATDQWQLNATAQQWDPAPWAKFFAPDIVVSGSLNTSIQAQRTKSDFRMEGYLKAQLPTLTITPLKVSIQNVVIDLHSTNGKVEIVNFTGKTKKGDIHVTGSSQLPALDYALQARQFVIEPAPKSTATADIDLALKGSVASPKLTGHIALVEATYNVPKKESKKKTDAKKTDQTVSFSSSTWTLAGPPSGAIDVALQWPRNVWYRDGISSIETRGDIRIQKADQSRSIILTGNVTSLRGSYNYFGRTFNIDSGEIQFAGTPTVTPLLNVEASYASGATTVYLDVTGTPQQPVLKMHSNPPLAEQDIVSVIVFGQPLNELRTRTGGASSNQEMMQAVGGILGGYVSQGLNETGIPLLNFDMLNIQPADQGGSQITVGRYLTRKLFISYGQTVQGSAEKSITADYFLTDKWTLQGASDSTEGNYLDLLFRYPLNKHGAAANNSPLPNSPFRNTLDQPAAQSQFRTSFQ